ncbi:MAG: NAD(P)-dependent alcohol dehydrogenase [Pseudomonadota bacterium]|nr:NAD(P)-dependent alcohol dehydrogenase [Pseudomonadota bacterium]
MDIRAAVVRQKGGPFSVENATLADPGPDQILVKIVAAGMCHTDLTIRDQNLETPLPFVLGHEGAGVVEKVGANVRKVAPGDHVVLTFFSCGSCANCLAHKPLCCLNAFPLNFGGRAADGGCSIHDQSGKEVGCSFFGQSSFATYALSYERNTIPVPKDVPLEILGPLGCGVQTGAGSVLNALDPPAGSSIAIFGAGAVGLSAVMGAVVAGCTQIISIDIKQNRLDLARELGATHVIDASTGNPVEEVMKLTGGLGVPYMLETTGNAQVLAGAVYAISMGGVGGIVGAPAMGETVNIDINFMLFNRTLRGIIEGDSNSDVFIPRLIELYKQGRFPFDKLIKFYSLDEINQAAEDSEGGATLKPVLKLV